MQAHASAFALSMSIEPWHARASRTIDRYEPIGVEVLTNATTTTSAWMSIFLAGRGANRLNGCVLSWGIGAL